MKKVALLLLITLFVSVINQPSIVLASDDNMHGNLELRCINISNPDQPIGVGDIFEIQIVANEIVDLYGYSINFIYDPKIMSVHQSVYQESHVLTVTESVYNQTVIENIYGPYIHTSIFENMNTLKANLIYPEYIGTKDEGILLSNLCSASYIELLIGKENVINISNNVIARLRFRALKESIIPIIPSNIITDIAKGSNIIIQMANSIINEQDKIPYDIVLPYGEIIIGDGVHTPPRTFSFIYKDSDTKDNNTIEHTNKVNKTNDESINFLFALYNSLWQKTSDIIISEKNNIKELKKTLMIIKKQRDASAKIIYELNEEEILNIIRENRDIENLILYVPVVEHFESDKMSVSLTLNTLKNVKDNDKNIILRFNTTIGSYQINLSSLQINHTLYTENEDIKPQFTKLILELSQVSKKNLHLKETVNSSIIADGISIKTYLKYGNNESPLLNAGYWFEYIIPSHIKGKENENVSTIGMLVKDDDLIVIPVKILEESGEMFAKIKTLCVNGTLYLASESALSKSEVKLDNKYMPQSMAQLILRRIFRGYSDGQLYGEAMLTRSQFTILLSRLFGMSDNKREYSIFSDVQITDWYNTSIVQLNELGWIKGYPDGSFKPNNIITVEEIEIVIKRIIDWNYIKMNPTKYKSPKQITEVKESTEEYKIFENLSRYKESTISRNEVSKILKILEKILGIE